MRHQLAPPLLLVLAFLAPALFAGEAAEQELKRWFFTGVLDGKEVIQMELGQSLNDPSAWDGFFYHEKGDGQRLRLEGSLDAARAFQLTEWTPGKTYDDDEEETGKFEGRFDAGFTRAEGSWSSTDGKRKSRFELKQVVGYRQKVELTPFTVEKLPEMDCLCEANKKAAKTPPNQCACLAKGDLVYPSLPGKAMEGMREVGLLNGPSKEDRESGEGVSWGDRLSVEHLSENLVSLRADNYFSYYGAAHPMNTIFGVLLGAADGKAFKPLPLDGIYAHNEKCLNRLNEAIRADLEVQEAPAVVDEHDTWGVDLKKLYAAPFNYRAGHLVFFYSPYEVGPYAMGPFEAKVSLRKLADCIPAKSPLAPFAK